MRRRQLEQSEEDATAELRGSLVLQGIRSHTTDEFDDGGEGSEDEGDNEAGYETKMDPWGREYNVSKDSAAIGAGMGGVGMGMGMGMGAAGMGAGMAMGMGMSGVGMNRNTGNRLMTTEGLSGRRASMHGTGRSVTGEWDAKFRYL